MPDNKLNLAHQSSPKLELVSWLRLLTAVMVALQTNSHRSHHFYVTVCMVGAVAFIFSTY